MIAAPYPRSDRGETSIQTVVLVPVVFVLVLMCFHVGVLMHQTNVAELAALRGASIASSMDYSADTQHRVLREVQQVVSDLNSTLQGTPEIDFRDGGVHVRVQIKSTAVLSFLPTLASADVWRPWESFRREQDRQ